MRTFGLSVHGKLKAFGCFAALATLALCVGAAQGAVLLTYDLRIAPTQPAGVTRVDAHTANTTAVGQVVALQLFAVIHNGNADQTDDGFEAGQGSFVSSPNGAVAKLPGTLRGAGTPTTPSLLNNAVNFRSTGATSGAPSAYEADGVVDDVGRNSTGTGEVNDWFNAFSGPTPFFGTGTTGDLEQLIGTTAFTVTGGGASSKVNFIPRLVLTGSATVQNTNLFSVDDATFNGNFALRSDDQRIATLGSIINGVIVPEPGSIVMFSMGAVGLLLWRVRRNGKTG